ncbi:MAG: hypothetical protein AB1724_09830 [Thermodesulfobacteriota bacterium]
MPIHDLFNIFISRFNRLPVQYMITGAVASIMYGEPRLTHDLDCVLTIEKDGLEAFCSAFPIESFYCPPLEVIQIELGRGHRGHFNLIHHETGFKADIYLAGQDELHQWAMARRRPVDVGGETYWVAPVEYVIFRKLEYYKEGHSEKHLRDIAGMLNSVPDQIDFKELESRIEKAMLADQWRKAKAFPL